jgi:Activator of Hsp90 ATPase homolog 1-like protein
VSEGTKGVESIVLVTLEPKGEQTDVTLRHSGVPEDEMGLTHKDGWTWVLSMLAERFTSRPPAAPSS